MNGTASPLVPIDLASSESLVGMKVDTSSLKWFASSCPVFDAQLRWLQAYF